MRIPEGGKMKRAFLICPVRGADWRLTRIVCEELEAGGWQVYWPPRDTNQQDETGYQICLENLEAIKKSDMIFVVWDGKSQGCLFDLGIAFALGKPIREVNLPPATRHKSFQNMIRFWESQSSELDIQST